MFTTFINYVFMFFAYSAIGWTVESTYRSLGERRIINSGFLHGPMCPIYGTGGLVFYVCLKPISQPLEKRLLLVLILGMILADTVEYITSYLMEKLFHARWWDYSNNFLNLHGRICFKHTIYWAIFSFVYVYVVAPIYDWVNGYIPQNVRNIAVLVIFILFAFDLVMTVKDAINIQKAMTKLENLKSTLINIGDTVKTAAENLKDTADNRLDNIANSISVNSEKINDRINDISAQFSDIRKQFENLENGKKETGATKGTKRLLSNSNLRSSAEKTYTELEAFWNELKKRIKNYTSNKEQEK